ncbi:MAG: 50S ribosomal protein L6 [Bacilli bacterium]|nr:50S ribosomal protein L6 [Bacilli bacterium]
MSRIGNRKLTIPAGVTVEVNGQEVTVKSSKGELKTTVSNLIEVKVSEGVVETIQKQTTKEANIMQGTTNSNIQGMIEGLSKGFSIGLEAVGVGYRFAVSGNKITINAGYSHPVVKEVPAGLKAELVSATEITISGFDKQKVAEFAANVRKVRQPEPYKGKGIRYKDEIVHRKEGKKAA